MKKAFYLLAILTALLSVFLSCSNDDDLSSNTFSFLKGALKSATNERLEGIWTITQLEFQGELLDVPISVVECGRDFFNFQSGGAYKDYIFDDNHECTPQINTLSWSLSNGIIRVNNGIESDQWVITELTSDLLVFKFRLDVNSDGELEIYKAICNRYEPPIEIDSYSETFYWLNSVETNDRIELEWDEYRGYNQFEKYEIYRLNESCDLGDYQLISTITEINQTSFIDENPMPWSEICYVFKIYTNKGLLGESDPVTVDTSSIVASSVNLSQPILNNATVELNWNEYKGRYFSHYEIEVRNFSSGSGGGYQTEKLVEINDVTTTNYTTEVPYFSNPVFVIHTYNIFGYRSHAIIEGQNKRSTSFVRDEILPINTIRFFAFSPNETILYYSDYGTLYRYNYSTNSIENSASINSSSIDFLKVVESSFGTEVIMNTGSELKVYDSGLNFKYNLNINNTTISAVHLAYSENDFWLITNREKLYSFSRSTNNLNLISENSLYNERFCCSTINVLDIKQNRILVGNHTKSQGLIVGINVNGELTNTSTSVALNMTSEWKNNSLFSEDKNYLLNTEDNTLFSTNTYNLITTLNQDFFPSGISNDGSLILGTNNNPDSNSTSVNEKKVKLLSYPSLNEQLYDSKGYPHVVFQNHLGQIVSISKGLLGKINSSTPENDIFVEIIDL